MKFDSKAFLSKCVYYCTISVKIAKHTVKLRSLVLQIQVGVVLQKNKKNLSSPTLK